MSLPRCVFATSTLCKRIGHSRRPYAQCKPDGEAQPTGNDAKSTGPPFPVHPGYLKLKQKQAEYSRDDGKPVWLKRPTDSLLFGLTWAIMFVAVGMQFQMIYQMAVPKKE